MYISPQTERMRKRKAFAGTEFDGNSASHLYASSLPSSSSVSNLAPSYSRLSMLTLPQNEHLSNIIDYHTLRPTAITSENNATEYLSTRPTTTTINDYHLSESMRSKSTSSPSSPSLSLSPLPLPSLLPPQHKIRIIDDAKIVYMRRQITEPSLIYDPLTAGHNNEYTSNAKPKLSFSIESIIGIKWNFIQVHIFANEIYRMHAHK